MVGEVPDEQLAEGMSDPDVRKMVLDEIFKRMADHVQPGQVEGVDALVHFKITDAPGGGADVYEVVIRDGQVRVNEEPTVENPRVAIITAPRPLPQAGDGAAVRSGPIHDRQAQAGG